MKCKCIRIYFQSVFSFVHLLFYLNHTKVVDNLKPTDIVILFSAISRLHEPPPLAVDEPKKPHTAGKRGDKPDLEKDTTNMTDLTIDGRISIIISSL